MKKLAIIGSGIAGMSAAYFLKDHFEIVVFEKNNYPGGHTNTVDVFDGQKKCPMDTGFMVYNEVTYPLLTKLFNKLNVPTIETDMSFSVYHESSGLEYNGSSVGGLFTQKKNLFNFQFLKMLYEITKFNKHAINLIKNQEYENLTIKEFVHKLGLSSYFLEKFLIPMSGAVWSTAHDQMLEFPAKSLVQFFYNHGFLGLETQHQWRTVQGGSREYRSLLIKDYETQIRIEQPALSLKENNQKVYVKTHNEVHEFDLVILACHGDEALQLLEKPSVIQHELLSCFKYQKNIATIHTDEKMMPKLKKNWSSWNYIIKEKGHYTTYYMNSLQGVSQLKNFFVNINGEEYVNPQKIIQQIVYHHPLFDLKAMNAQKHLAKLNDDNGKIKFCGSYFRYGFHEDALWSSVILCEKILNKKVL